LEAAMPLTREQRFRLARALGWSRANGWKHDAYPNCWRSADGRTHVRYDTAEETLVVDHLQLDQDPLRCRVALIPIDDPDRALRMLAALGHLPDLDAWPEPEIADETDGTGPAAAAPDAFDGPASFAEAGQVFADLVDGDVMPDRAAEVLSQLARAGLIVSVAYYDETVAGGGEAAADEISYPASLGVVR
jgi:hypothetical protein